MTEACWHIGKPGGFFKKQNPQHNHKTAGKKTFWCLKIWTSMTEPLQLINKLCRWFLETFRKVAEIGGQKEDKADP